MDSFKCNIAEKLITVPSLLKIVDVEYFGDCESPSAFKKQNSCFSDKYTNIPFDLLGYYYYLQ